MQAPNSKIVRMECRRLENINGRKIDHPPNGSKDVSDSEVGVCHTLMTAELEPVEVTEEVHAEDTGLPGAVSIGDDW